MYRRKTVFDSLDEILFLATFTEKGLIENNTFTSTSLLTKI